jgi:soluble P-type ATPase
MNSVDIPGFGNLELRYLVLDFNGTMASDGALIPGVRERIEALAEDLEVHVLTADTFGTCAGAVAGLPVKLAILSERPEDAAKCAYARMLGAKSCACIGNGANDWRMLEVAAVGVAVLGPECTAAQAVAAADIIAPGILEALDLLLHPMRLRATLRS